jgi:TATA-box binding protein (TBP) (component of TFIID and TFIIIB)
MLLKATTDVQAKDLQLKDREIKISQLTEKPNNTNPVASLKLSEEDKASLIYQSVDMAIKKCKYSDDIGMALINILQNIQGNYSNKAQLDNKIKEIKKRIGQTF